MSILYRVTNLLSSPISVDGYVLDVGGWIDVPTVTSGMSSAQSKNAVNVVMVDPVQATEPPPAISPVSCFENVKQVLNEHWNIRWDLYLGTVAEVVLKGHGSHLAKPLNMTPCRMVLIARQNEIGGYSLTFDPVYKFPSAPVIPSGPGRYAVIAMSNDGESIVCETFYSTSNNVAPVVTAGQSFTFPENSSVGQNVGTVLATDDVAVIDFRFTNTQTSLSSDGYFSIDSDGVVTLTAAGASSAFNNYDDGDITHVYSVQAMDNEAVWSAGQNITISVTDVSDSQAPVVTAGQSFSYPEGRVPGTVVATVLATDDGPIIDWRFTTTGTHISADSYLVIDTAGHISLTSAGAASAINDFETLPNSFVYGVQAGDDFGNWSTSQNVTLNVTDIGLGLELGNYLGGE